MKKKKLIWIALVLAIFGLIMGIMGRILILKYVTPGIPYAILYLSLDDQNKDDYEIQHISDNRGFHGDGSVVITLHLNDTASQSLEQEIQQNNNTDTNVEWKALPQEEDQHLLLYGGSQGSGNSINYNFASDANIPDLSNGYYTFVDEQTDQQEKSILYRTSYDFHYAVYSPDTQTLYYLEIHT